MVRFVACTLVLLLCITFARADALEPGDREVTVRYSTADIDMGMLYGEDLGSATQRRIAASIGWIRTRVVALGIDASWLEMEPDATGYSYGVFLQAHIPAGNVVVPYFTVGLSIVDGDIRDLYQWEAELGAGVKVYPSRRFGFMGAISYDRFSPQDDLPGAEGARLSLGALFKF